MTMIMTSIAWADDISNDLDASIDADAEVMNLAVGGSNGSTTLSVTPRNGDGKPGCNLTGSTTFVVAVTSSNMSVATVSPSSVTFTSCGDTPTLTVTPVATGTTTVSLSQTSNNTGATFNLSPATFTVNVTSPPPTDTTPPVITPSASGTLGDDGWYVSDVTVTWDVTDNESTVSSTSGCGPTTIDSDTSGTTLTCTATSAGGTDSASIAIKRDATVPTISGDASPAPNAEGWNNTDVTVSFSCADALSGNASCGPDETLSSDGADQSSTGMAVDYAGNTASATVSGINIDKTAPVIIVSGVANGATYVLGSVPTAGCTTSDALSGVATEATLGSSGGPVGSMTATCSGALDKAGNPGSSSVTYNVVFDWAGFFRPVDNLPTLNQVKAGSAVPIKFSLGGNQGLGIMAAGFPRSISIGCDASSTVDAIEETLTAGGSSLSYDPLADQYVYVWKTDKSWTGCRQLSVRLTDGTVHYANFKFTK